MIDERIKELASREESEAPFLTLYLDTNSHDDPQREKLRLFLKDELKRARDAVGNGNGQAREMDAALRRIERFVEESLAPETRGLAIFFCPQEDFFLPIQLPVPVQSHLIIGSRPHLKPLTILRQEYPHAIVALVDAKSARLFALEFGRVLDEIDLEHPDMPRRHDQGGWSQANLQRHVQDHIDRHHKEVAETLAKLVDKGRFSHVILSGQERNVANFRSFLPKKLDEKVLGTLHLDIRSTADQVVEACHQLLSTHRTATLEERLSVLEDAARMNSRGVLGVPGVVEAANQRRLIHLFLRRDSEEAGWTCRSCGMLGHSVPLSCPACGGPVRSVDLIEQLIAAAQREGADVAIVPDPSLLEKHEGVGALLRF